jgi:hypothetical protein
MHSCLASSGCLPALHSVQRSPVVEYSDTPMLIQLSHTVRPDPGADPGGQKLHIPLAPARPGGQSIHDMKFASSIVPLAHCEHTPTPPALPCSHLSQTVLSVLAALPSAHCSHSPPVPAFPGGHATHVRVALYDGCSSSQGSGGEISIVLLSPVMFQSQSDSG